MNNKNDYHTTKNNTTPRIWQLATEMITELLENYPTLRIEVDLTGPKFIEIPLPIEGNETTDPLQNIPTTHKETSKLPQMAEHLTSQMDDLDKCRILKGIGENPKQKTLLNRLRIMEWLHTTFGVDLTLLLAVNLTIFIKLSQLDCDELDELQNKI
ncbi:10956_t:CDS:2, partial [Ambispora gerdemannii]